MFGVPPLAMDFGELSRTAEPATKGSKSSTVPAESISPIVRSAVAIEFASIRHEGHCPLGLYVLPNEANFMVWDGVFFVHQGYYADAVLKFRILFPNNYPERPPVVEFSSQVFHPLVSEATGQFNLAPRFRPWRPKEHHTFDVLHYLKAAFKKQTLDALKDHDCLNKEAFRLYHESTSTFSNLASQTTQLSQSPATLFHRETSKGKPNPGFVFAELNGEEMYEVGSKLGLKEWSTN